MKKIISFLFAILFSLFTYHFSLITVSAHSSTIVVKMTQNGFEPMELTVDQNTTLIFVNQDTISHWPASNIHPTHELYPEFDPRREIKPGESWSFKPTKPGTWKYHDHLDPHLRGAITVMPEKSSTTLTSPTLLDSLKNTLTSFFDKIRSLFITSPKEMVKVEEFKNLPPAKQFEILTQLAKRKGAPSAWKYVTDTYQDEAGSSGNIHDLAHLAGKLLYEDKGIAGIGLCTVNFAFGCYHGLLDTAFNTSLQDLPLAETECGRVGPVNSGPYGSCIHGIGHGVASYHQSKNIEESLKDCNRLTAGQNFCHDGVLMEFARSANNNFYSQENPLYPCDQLEKEYGQIYSVACGRNQPPVLMGKFKLGFEEVAQICANNTLSSQFKNACFEALGFSLASSQDPLQIIKGCRTIKNIQYSGLCFKAAAGELIFQDAPGWQEKSIKVCNSSPLAFRSLCHENIKRLIQEYGKELERKMSLLQDGQNKDEYVKSQMKICYEDGGKGDCYKKVAGLLSSQLGLRDTLEIFNRNEGSPEIYARCHEVTHYLSRNEYDRTKSIPAVYAQCDSTCHGGCYHGVLEQYLKEKNLVFDGIAREFPKVCGKTEDFNTPLIYNECLHGMGHAAMFVTDMELPDSLALCNTLGGQDAHDRCYSGVFMENSSSSTNNEHPGKYIKAGDPLYPCNWLAQKYQKICYRYQSSYFALITNHNWQETASLCLKVPLEYQDECFRTIGTNQVGFTQDTKLMRQNCLLMPTDQFQETCLTGVISSFAYRFVGDTKRMEDFCTQVNSEFQQSCFRQIGTAVLDWFTSQKEAKNLCTKIINSQYSSWCKEGVIN